MLQYIGYQMDSKLKNSLITWTRPPIHDRYTWENVTGWRQRAQIWKPNWPMAERQIKHWKSHSMKYSSQVMVSYKSNLQIMGFVGMFWKNNIEKGVLAKNYHFEPNQI